MAAFYDGEYRNVFEQCGYAREEIQKRVRRDYETVFFGPEELRIYHKTADGMGYLVDTGNDDVRTEGMSYGMMIAVQMDDKETFDRIWRWTVAHMWMKEGENKGYFAWSVRLDGTPNSLGPAPDGEEFFAMALLFAANRWGDGEGLLAYSTHARAILHECVHKGEDGIGHAMFAPENKLIRFVPNADFSDPSYHLPHFYELFALWGNPGDAQFFREAAAASRAYLRLSCHPVTGLAAEYAEYDGTPRNLYNHDLFYSDAYRVAANIALDFEWFGKDPWQITQANNIQRFFGETVMGGEDQVFAIDGTPVTDAARVVQQADATLTKVLHPVGLLATNAQASLASDGPYREYFVRKLWETPLRTGKRRYYDNLLYLFAMLALSGQYRIYSPKA